MGVAGRIELARQALRSYRTNWLRATVHKSIGWVRSRLQRNLPDPFAYRLSARRQFISPAIARTPAVIVVSHDWTRTGAPILILSAISELERTYPNVTILLGPGFVIDEFRRRSEKRWALRWRGPGRVGAASGPQRRIPAQLIPRQEAGPDGARIPRSSGSAFLTGPARGAGRPMGPARRGPWRRRTGTTGRGSAVYGVPRRRLHGPRSGPARSSVAVTSPTVRFPIHGKTSTSVRCNTVSAWLLAHAGDCLANHSRATASKPLAWASTRARCLATVNLRVSSGWRIWRLPIISRKRSGTLKQK